MNQKQYLTKDEAEKFRKHLKSVETRNKAIGIILMFAFSIVAGFGLEYYALQGVSNALAQFFLTFGILLPIWFIDLKITLSIGFDKSDAALAVAAAAVALVVAAAAVAAALAGG